MPEVNAKMRQEGGANPAQSSISEQMISSQIGQIRNLLKEIDIASVNFSQKENREVLMKYSAIQSCIAAIEGHESEAYSKANVELFGLQVDALDGGPTAKTLGGRRIGQKLSVQEYYLRAAALVLWRHYRRQSDENRLNQLIADARTIIGVGTKKKLAKMVDNHDRIHDVDLTKTKSPLSVHIPGIEDLVKHHGYLRLKDFT